MNIDGTHATSYDETLGAIKGICKIPARLTGFFSLIVQICALLVVVGITFLIFVHVGGIAMLRWSNATASDELFPTPEMLRVNELLVSNSTSSVNISGTQKRVSKCAHFVGV